MSVPLKPLTVQRLAYVRYLYQEGIEQSREPSPLRARAITSFHDAVENFMGLAAEQLGIELPKGVDFGGYWTALKPGIELPGKAPLKRLNDARVALKHNGTFPSDHQIEQAREALADFFSTVTPKVFHVDFDSVDLVDLVTQAAVAQYLRDAQTHADAGDYSMAGAGLYLAFEALLDIYVDGDIFGTAPFAFGPSIRPLDRPRLDGQEAPRDGRLAKLTTIATTTQRALRVIILGIDYIDWARFQITMPIVHGYYNNTQRYWETESARSISAEDYDWARRFVIDSALHAGRADEVAKRFRAREVLDRRDLSTGVERNWTGPAEAENTE